MKTYKLIDFRGQVLLIVASLLSLLWSTELAFFGYFFVGGWQVISCLIHLSLTDKYLPVHDRAIYNKTLAWVFILAILSIPVWILYGFLLLIVSPFLAIWYASICYAENKLMEQRAFAHLK